MSAQIHQSCVSPLMMTAVMDTRAVTVADFYHRGDSGLINRSGAVVEKYYYICV